MVSNKPNETLLVQFSILFNEIVEVQEFDAELSKIKSNPYQVIEEGK